MLIILALAAAVGFSANELRREGLPLAAYHPPGAEKISERDLPLTVTLEEAESLYRQGAAVFIDARHPDQFGKGHIRGALNLPWHAVDDTMAEVVDKMPPHASVITYCEGEACSLSRELALFLRDTGFADTRVLVDGWGVWRRANLPVETTE